MCSCCMQYCQTCHMKAKVSWCCVEASHKLRRLVVTLFCVSYKGSILGKGRGYEHDTTHRRQLTHRLPLELTKGFEGGKKNLLGLAFIISSQQDALQLGNHRGFDVFNCATCGKTRRKPKATSSEFTVMAKHQIY